MTLHTFLALMVISLAGLSTTAVRAQQFTGGTTNFGWPAQKGKTFYDVDFDFRVEGRQNSVYVHTFVNLQTGSIYFGAHTDENGDLKTFQLTVWFNNRDDFDKKHYVMSGSGCRPDDRRVESAAGYVTCFLSNLTLSRGKWYRMRVWQTGQGTAADGTKLQKWGAWIIELDSAGKSAKETMIGEIGAPTGEITTASYSAFEGFGAYGPGMQRCVTISNTWYGSISLKFPTYNNGEVTSGAPTNAMVTDAMCNIRGRVVDGAVVVDYGPKTKPTTLDLVGTWNAFSADVKTLYRKPRISSPKPNEFDFDMGDGETKQGALSDAGKVSIPSLKLTGTVLPAAKMIYWSDNTYWVKQ